MSKVRRLWPIPVWTAVLILVTLVMRALRSDADQAHVVLAYLLVVLGASVSGGRNLGLALAFVAFLLIDWFFQLPYGEITVSKPLDWLILISFLVTSLVATQLLAMARSEAAAARRQADAIAVLSAEHERLMAEAEHAKALREADRLKDIVLASLSHDLRTPLTTIKALAQESALRGDANAKVIEEQADRLSRFVGDLLDISRLKGGAFTVTPELNTAEDLLGAATRQVAGLLNGRTVVSRVDASAPALLGRFDFVQSLRILTNLIENALRYAPAASTVELAVQRTGSMLDISVLDRGPGVPIADRDLIFDLFYRVADSHPDTGHAGLGLAIARRLAELQGGTLEYQPRLGGGSAFVLRLPAIDSLVES
jgi:two-component system sensor histidine kinase KdpD